MITDYIERRYPFILHRQRWRYNLAPAIALSSCSLIPLTEDYIDFLIPLILSPNFSGFYDEVSQYKFKLKEALKRVVLRGGHWVIISEESKEVIGELIILEEEKGKWEVSYWLDSKLWGRGIMTNIVREFADWVFANTSLTSLYARYTISNLPSRRVLEKVGFTEINRVSDSVMMRLDKNKDA